MENLENNEYENATAKTASSPKPASGKYIFLKEAFFSNNIGDKYKYIQKGDVFTLEYKPNVTKSSTSFRYFIKDTDMSLAIKREPLNSIFKLYQAPNGISQSYASADASKTTTIDLNEGSNTTAGTFVSLAGLGGAVYLAHKHGKGFWGYVGYMVVASIGTGMVNYALFRNKNKGMIDGKNTSNPIVNNSLKSETETKAILERGALKLLDATNLVDAKNQSPKPTLLQIKGKVNQKYAEYKKLNGKDQNAIFDVFADLANWDLSKFPKGDAMKALEYLMGQTESFTNSAIKKHGANKEVLSKFINE